MARFYFFLCCLLSGLSLYGQPTNFGFEQRTADGKPSGWNRFGADYLFTLDSTTKHTGKYGLRIAYTNDMGFSAADWQIPATFSGKNLTLTAYVKTEKTGSEPSAYAGLWMRVDNGEGKAIAFDNMQSRGIRGTTDWQPYTITLPLSDDASTIHIGGLLIGKGTAWFDDFSLTVDGKSFDRASIKLTKLAKAQTDTAFAKGSGIDLVAPTAQQIENLTVLGKVWGFVKYYHPAVAEGNHNMDAELFRIMPNLLTTTSTAQRSEVLLRWLTTFGPVKAGTTSAQDSSRIAHQPDLAWLADSKQVSAPLQAQLRAIQQAKRSDKSYYVTLFPQVGNPEFKHELSYRQMTTPDAGYRLLSLYRYWTIIQYFFPYKHLINQPPPGETPSGADWNNVLSEFIPVFINARDSLSYRLAALSLIGRIHDTHANVWGDRLIQSHYKGDYFAPAQVKFIEKQFIVTNFYNDSLGSFSGLRRGDVVKTIDGVATETLVRQRLPYYPASNQPTQLRDISRDLLAGHSSTVKLGIDREGKPLNLTVTRYKRGQAAFSDRINYSSYPKDSCYQWLHPDIGYLFMGNIKGDKLPQIMRMFKNTKGLIIDFRCYPSEFVVFSLGKYLTTPTPFAKFTSGSVSTPGLFFWHIPPVYVGERNATDAYKGKVIILVNEITQSSAEYHTMAFRQAPGALVIGSTTAGADGNISPFDLPGGLQTIISGIGVNYPDGRETQRVGVGVDVEMHPTRRGIQAGQDELLDKAIDLIRGSK